MLCSKSVIYILTPLPRDNEIPPFSSPPACGQRSVSGRILNGQTAKYGTWPWQVSVQRQGFHICGGSLVSERIPLPSHCTALLSACSPTDLIASNETSNQTLSSSVKQIILHPSYDNASFFADIALVELENPIAFTAVMSPICLLDASVHVPAGKSCWVTGWGNINPQESIQPDLLSNPVHSWAASGGDSGGPLVCKENDTWYLAGIVSWLLLTTVNGATSVAPGYPGVYNRPNAHNRWIQENVPGVNFTVVNFTVKSVNPLTTVPPNSAGPSAIIPRVLLFTVLLWLSD
uniref:Peptidase S1 domain-containing protein n=1 Tax=Pelusios castaneus TaxID=367368 RepID=A0A8C8SCC6_9SAUR